MGEAPLSKYRALDLTDEKGLYCGRILADFGVDVIKIEPPGGDRSRKIGPFRKNNPHPENSLYWLSYSANKRGITLNLETKDGQDLFQRLVKTADFVIESFPPGYLDRIGLGYSTLAKIKPDIILTSITPFGQSGPYKDYKASDLICWSLGGYAWIVGEPDRPPVQITFPQAFLHGAAEAAVATVIGNYHRLVTGEGQHIDLSIQACVTRDLMNAPLFWEINKTLLRRSGPFRVGLSIGAKQRLHWKCKDGYITFMMMGGAMGARDNNSLVDFMNSEGACPEFMKQIDWKKFDMSTASQELLTRFEDAIDIFFKTHTKQELYDGAMKRRMTIYPVATVKDLVEDTQLKARDFWEELDDPECGKVKYPGPPIRLSQSPCVRRKRAPRIGEHNRDIYVDELGCTEAELMVLKQAGGI